MIPAVIGARGLGRFDRQEIFDLGDVVALRQLIDHELSQVCGSAPLGAACQYQTIDPDARLFSISGILSRLVGLHGGAEEGGNRHIEGWQGCVA